MIRIAIIIFVVATSLLGTAALLRTGPAEGVAESDSSARARRDDASKLQAGSSLIPAPLRLVVEGRPIVERAIARRPVGRYHTVGVQLHPVIELDATSPALYWQQKLFSNCTVARSEECVDRWRAHPAEQATALAAAWQVLTDGTDGREALLLPAGSNGFSPLYGLVASPIPADKPRVDMFFIAEVSSMPAVVELATFTDGEGVPFNSTASGFKQSELQSAGQLPPVLQEPIGRWLAKAEIGERWHLLHISAQDVPEWISALVRRTPGEPPTVSLFALDARPTPSRLPAGYDRFDVEDIKLEQSASESQRDPARTSVQSVSGLAGLNEIERRAAKMAIGAYAGVGVEDAQVDCRVPRSRSNPAMLFTLRFQKPTAGTDVDRTGGRNCEVIVERRSPVCLPEHREAALADADGVMWILPPAVRAMTDHQLADWWNARHPGAMIERSQLPVREQIRRQLVGGLSSDWFERNYKLYVLDADQVAPWLKLHSGPNQADATRAERFSQAELLSLELALCQLPPAAVACLPEVRLTRQTGGRADGRGMRSQGGLTVFFGKHVTIQLFDAAGLNDASLFMGDDDATWDCWTQTLIHEIGHVYCHRAGLEGEFNRGFGAGPMVTWYAASKPDTELFPEAFMLYALNPRWTAENRPDLHAWFAAARPAAGKLPASTNPAAHPMHVCRH